MASLYGEDNKPSNKMIFIRRTVSGAMYWPAKVVLQMRYEQLPAEIADAGVEVKVS